jgi:hypothetical protein
MFYTHINKLGLGQLVRALSILTIMIISGVGEKN